MFSFSVHDDVAKERLASVHTWSEFQEKFTLLVDVTVMESSTNNDSNLNRE